jgi:hypothetical protein
MSVSICPVWDSNPQSDYGESGVIFSALFIGAYTNRTKGRGILGITVPMLTGLRLATSTLHGAILPRQYQVKEH